MALAHNEKEHDKRFGTQERNFQTFGSVTKMSFLRETEIDKEAEAAIKLMSDNEIDDLFNTEQVDLLRTWKFKSESGKLGMAKRWGKMKWDSCIT